MSCSVFVCHPSHCGNDLKWLSHVIGTLPSFGALMKLLSFLLACYGNPHKGSEHFRIVSRYAVVAVVNRSVASSTRGAHGTRRPVLKTPGCRIPKSGAITQEAQGTLRAEDSVRKRLASRHAVGGPYLLTGRHWTPHARGLPAMGPLVRIPH